MDDQTFMEYLRVKKALDDRSLNAVVWKTLVEAMPAPSPRHPWRVLEIGAGIGTMIQRLIEWDFLRIADYTALDASPSFLDEARHSLSRWAERHQISVEHELHTLTLSDPTRKVKIDFVAKDVQRWLEAASQSESYDLLIAHAFLDLVNLDDTLPELLNCLKEGGLFYFTINFDGLTVFEPPSDLDELVLSLYHRTMEERLAGEKPSAGAFSGRRLLRALEQAGGILLRAGASDWVVHPIEGGYPDGEERFLSYLLQMIEQALTGRPELDPELLRNWLHLRSAQIQGGALTLIVHQLDVVGKRSKMR